MNIINVQNVSKNFANQKVINQVSFSIAEGSIVGLLGPNGAGKTTIIRLLNGVIDPTNGDIEVLGLNPHTDGEKVRELSGIVTESASLYHEMTAWDNLKFFAKIYNTQDNGRIKYLLEQFDMWEHKDKLVGTFSTGMKKRVALAKALLHKPKLLFLDEPTNGLDPEGIQMVIKYLAKVNKEEKVTILICSHVLHQLENICNNFLFINKGTIIEQGSRQELEEKYLKEVVVHIETNLNDSEIVAYKGKKVGKNQVEFHLPSKEAITPLLQKILQNHWVHSCTIMNNDLESLYFKIRGGSHE
ncbi:MAG TPA: ABC transporter ATP-binding protein [Pseudoneobacillus sp.]|nr:ABC transporter ATP-binding protein [Pseudoneobacillus sp.]